MKLGTKIESNLDVLEHIEFHKISLNNLKKLISNNELKHGASLACVVKYFLT